MNIDKHYYRKVALRKLEDISNKASRDEAICNALIQGHHYAKADTVLLYSPLKNEPDISAFVADALSKGKKIAYPRCESGGVMRFYITNGKDCLTKSKYGVMEPSAECEEVTDYENAVCIVPGLGFTRSGHRLGRGGGFYDRFLAEFHVYSIGVGYKETVFPFLPVEPTDVRLRRVILK